MFIAASAGAPHSGSITSSGPPSGNAPRKVSSRSPLAELDDSVGAELAGTRQPRAVAAGGHDAARAQQPRRLHGHQTDGAGRAEHEHPVGAPEPAGLHRVPAGDAGDAAAAAATSSSPSGSTHRSASSATNRSAIEPTAFTVCTRVPGASDVPSTTRPMPSRPATNGGSGR